MKNFLDSANWIWCSADPQYDEYGEFVEEFSCKEGTVTLQISADSNYAVYINGQLAAWGQYADFPYDKIYDEVDITRFCCKGTNRIAIIVWYYGLETTSDKLKASDQLNKMEGQYIQKIEGNLNVTKLEDLL